MNEDVFNGSIRRFLKTHDEITNMIARELTGIRSENSMKNVFLALKERGMIEPVPGKEIGPKSAWRKTDFGNFGQALCRRNKRRVRA